MDPPLAPSVSDVYPSFDFTQMSATLDLAPDRQFNLQTNTSVRHRPSLTSNRQWRPTDGLSRSLNTHALCFLLVDGHVISIELEPRGTLATHHLYLTHASYTITLRWNMSSLAPEIIHFRPLTFTPNDICAIMYLVSFLQERPCSQRFRVLRSRVYTLENGRLLDLHGIVGDDEE